MHIAQHLFFSCNARAQTIQTIIQAFSSKGLLLQDVIVLSQNKTFIEIATGQI